MIRILTTNEQRLKVLNSMRASHRGHQLLKQSRIESAPKEAIVEDRWIDETEIAGNDINMLKVTAEAMYNSTGDTIWLAF